MSLNVSPDWVAAIESPFRNQGYLRFSIEVVPPGMREGATALSSDTSPLTDVSRVIDGRFTDFRDVALCEHNRWVLGGTAEVLEADDSVVDGTNWWDNQLEHSPEHPSRIEFVFDEVYEIPGLYCVWDTLHGSWPTRLVVTGYNASDEIIQTYLVTSISQPSQFIETPFSGVKKIEMRIEGWSKPGWRAWCSEVIFGVYLNFDEYDVYNARTHSTVSVTSEELPVHTAEISLGNFTGEFDPLLIDGYSKYFKAKQKATWQWGFKLPSGVIEWADSQTYFLSDAAIPANESTFTVAMGSRLDFLNNEYRKGTFTNTPRTFGDIAREILDNSDLLREATGETPYELSETLEALTTKAPIPVMNTNELLQYIASATGTILTINPTNGYVAIKDLVFPERSKRTIGQEQQLGDPGIEIREELHSINISVYSYNVETSATPLFDGQYVLSGQAQIEVNYPTAVDPVATVTGGTLNSAQYFANCAILTITPTTPGVAVSVAVSGKKVTSSKTFFETYTNTQIDRGLVVEVDNPFITEYSQLAALTTYLRNFYEKRQRVSMKYTGYPELLGGDEISTPNKYGTANGDLIEHAIEFNGGWTGTAVVQASD